MKVIKATEYPEIFRTVLRVCFNPDDPEWVHKIGKQRKDIDGELMVMEDESPMFITSSDIEPDCTGETCHNCKYNWEVREFVFDGKSRFYNDEGQTVAKTVLQYIEDIKKILDNEVTSSSPQSDWVGVDF